MPVGPQKQKRSADAIGRAIMVARVAMGEIEEKIEKTIGENTKRESRGRSTE